MKIASLICTSALFIIGLGIFHTTFSETSTAPQTESIPDLAPPENEWIRPTGPARVALQVGHWKNAELPDEFINLRENGGGAQGGGKAEWEVNLAIAEHTAQLLKEKGIIVDILPATVPSAYWADVLIAIHADGSESKSVSGYKVAAPRRDITGKAGQLASFVETEYGKIVNLSLDPNITRNMRGYYVFNWRRYLHAMHPMTVASIIETGFLTSPNDQKILINKPELAAKGIANGIFAYLESQQLLVTTPQS